MHIEEEHPNFRNLLGFDKTGVPPVMDSNTSIWGISSMVYGHLIWGTLLVDSRNVTFRSAIWKFYCIPRSNMCQPHRNMFSWRKATSVSHMTTSKNWKLRNLTWRNWLKTFLLNRLIIDQLLKDIPNNPLGIIIELLGCERPRFNIVHHKCKAAQVVSSSWNVPHANR